MYSILLKPSLKPLKVINKKYLLSEKEKKISCLTSQLDKSLLNRVSLSKRQEIPFDNVSFAQVKKRSIKNLTRTHSHIKILYLILGLSSKNNGAKKLSFSERSDYK